jgi:hypothetical protein
MKVMKTFWLLCFVTLTTLLKRDVCDADSIVVNSGPAFDTNTFMVMSGPNEEKAITITQALLGNTYSNKSDR